MKMILSLLLLTLSAVTLNAQVTFDALTFSTPYPQVSQKLTFTFDQKMSPLKSEKNLEFVVYEFTGKGLKVFEPVMKNAGSKYTGTVQLDSNATAIAFGISAGTIKDNNGGKGYILPVYNKTKMPVKGYYAHAGQLHAGQGEFLFGMAKDQQKNLDLLQSAFIAYPELKNDINFYNGYLSSLSLVKKKEAEPVILDRLAQIEKKPILTEEDYGMLNTWYTRLKMKSRSDSLTAAMKQQYPAGKWGFNDMIGRFFREKSAPQKVRLYDSIMAAMPAADKANDQLRSQLKLQIANAYVAEKNFPMFKKTVMEMTPVTRASAYNSVSWNLAEAGENIQDAKAMSEEATMWAQQQLKAPTDKQPQSLTRAQWKKQRESDYAMYADTYAFILYNTGDYTKGLPYATEAAKLNNLTDPELNERYAMLLEKAAPANEAKRMIEQMVTLGKASPKTKDALKALYVKEKGSDAGFDVYVTALEEKAAAKRRADLLKSMINTASPKFTLKDWEGKEVSLESLKGKVVVVDFWATWCGPCIASMPGMKKAQDKFAGRDDVKFLFVDTWENVENKLENSKDFMKKKNYPFYVLMDNEDKMVKDFDVSGIPTKFIIDRSGNIRFKSVGFDGNTDALAEEVITMIDLAGK